MVWLAVDKDRSEWIFNKKLIRSSCDYFWIKTDSEWDMIRLPVGSIEKLIGRKLTWEDELVEI